MNSNDRKLLKEELGLMEDAITMLRHSYDKCCNIELRNDLGMDEQESFEALCNRFARASDYDNRRYDS